MEYRMTLLTAAEAVNEPALWSEEWWSQFLRSAGFGGVAAVCAAFVAFLGVLAKSLFDGHLARRARQAVIDDSTADRWWEMYRWSLAQLGTLDPDPAIELLGELEESAPGDVEKRLVLVAIRMYTWSGDEEGEAP
jgi:hypothetical protein